jgi:tetratricopeptide (TPR) repeat protein
MNCLGHRIALLVSAWAVLTLSPSTARADQARARIHFEKGKTFFEVDEYDKAIVEFKAAHVEKADPAFLFNIAECYRHLGEPREALVFYRRFLSLSPANDRSRPIVERRIAELQAAPDQTPAARTEPAPEPARAPIPVPLAAPPVVESSTLVAQTGPGPDRSEGSKPFYARGWFIVTVGLVVVAGAVGFWTLSRGSDPPETPLGNQRGFP